MLIGKMKEFPKSAGVVTLDFLDGKNKIFKTHARGQPVIQGSDIYLPLERRSHFVALQGGKQFLFHYRNPDGYTEFTTYFGGTDESSAFLTELPEDVNFFAIYEMDGEEAFYESLKPGLVRNYEKRFRTTALRQGDLFAVPIGNWADVKKAWHLVIPVDLTLKPVSSTILDTRHTLHGSATDDFSIIYHAISNYSILSSIDCMFGQGTLEAPDHEPLRLEGIHFITLSLASDS